MLTLVHPELHGYIGADLDEKGEPIKIVCDTLEVIAYYIDSQTSPMTSLAVTYARVDPNNQFRKGGPFTQHLIVGLELIEILEASEGITIKAIEESTLRTGIPMAYIRPEDLKPYEGSPPTPVWEKRMIEDIQAKLEAQKRMQEQAVMPPNPNMMPGHD